ncbi:MAG: IS3 family transposase [Verrucomicrobiota bacterium]
MRETYTMAELCKALEVSSSGYYKWRRSEPGARELGNTRLVEEMREIHAHRHTCVYGSPRMTLELRERGLACSENRVAALMAREGLCARGRRAFRPKTTQGDRHAVPAPNRLAERPPARAPGEALVSDITYVATREGWLYLAVVIDFFSRAVLGWKIGESLETALILDALEGALHVCDPPPEALFHSDRGCQYTSGIFRSRLKHHGLLQSMSDKGYCYDNAFAESFFATLKTESFPDDGIFGYLETGFTTGAASTAPSDTEARKLFSKTTSKNKT